MAKDTVILKVDGNVSVADFRTVVNAFVDLLFTLTAETNAEAPVDWVVDDLRGGSATIVSRALFGNAEGESTVTTVVEKYQRLAVQAHAGRIDEFSDRVIDAMHAMTSVVNGRIPQILMGTPDEPEPLTVTRLHKLADAEEVAPVEIEPRPYSFTAIKGQVVTLDKKHGTYFTLQQSYTGRHIRCYPKRDAKGDLREKLGRYWAEGTVVIVEGRFTRYGSSPTITEIRQILELPPGEPGGWRKAVGAAPRPAGSSDISAAEAVRRVRDA
jgi:hypothetical protein